MIEKYLFLIDIIRIVFKKLLKKFDSDEKHKIYKALIISKGSSSINRQNEDISNVLKSFFE